MMIDPAVGVRPTVSGAYDRGSAADVWMKEPNGTDHMGGKPTSFFFSRPASSFPLVVWPGVVVWPDWFHPSVQSFWNNEFKRFFNPADGIDVDGAWIDMNEPASFCTYPCDDPYKQAKDQNLPPPRNGPPPSDALYEAESDDITKKRRSNDEIDLLNPPYAIGNALPSISDRTAHTDVVHANGLVEYDTRTYLPKYENRASIEAECR